MKINYNNCKIYKIVDINDPTQFYVGSTCSKLCKRLSNHRSDSKQERNKNRHLFQYIAKNGGWDNFRIVLICDYPECENRRQQTKKEQEYMDKLKPTLNMTRAYTPTELKHTQCKCYREQNKDKIKQYREQNKDKIKQYRKQKYEENKDKIKQQRKEYREQNIDKIKERDNRYYQQNKEKCLQQNKQYREQNKDKIRQRKKRKYEQLKEYSKQKNQCECGCMIRKSGITRHRKSKKHETRMECKLCIDDMISQL